VHYLIGLLAACGFIALWFVLPRRGTKRSKLVLVIGIATIAVAIGALFVLPVEPASLADCRPGPFRYLWLC